MGIVLDSMERPLSQYRKFGPLVYSQSVTEGESKARDWKRDSATKNLAAPEGWDWQIDDELAHKVWNLTAKSDKMVFGPDPPVLLEAFMGFFPSEDMSSSLNSWYFTRKKGQVYNDHELWWQIGNQFQQPEGDADTTSILYSPELDPHPLRSKLHSQQYTVNGGMFTYDFTQWQGEQPSGMMRIPVDESILSDLRAAIEPTPFEEFQMQTRPYSRGSRFVEDTAEGTFMHPHYRADSKTTQEDYMQLFDIAFEFMDKSVEVEDA